MSRNYKFYNQNKPHFISFAVVNWIDVFIRPIYAEIIINSLNHCVKEKGLIIYGWCLMTSHMHLLIAREKDKFQDIVRDFKKFTSVMLIESIQTNIQESRKEWILNSFKQAGQQNSNNKNIQFWQQHNHPLQIDTERQMLTYLDYIHKNPLVSGLVRNIEDWPYSSAIDYVEGNGLVQIKKFCL